MGHAKVACFCNSVHCACCLPGLPSTYLLEYWSPKGPPRRNVGGLGFIFSCY